MSLIRACHGLDASPVAAILFNEGDAANADGVRPGSPMSALAFSAVIAKLTDGGRADDDRLRERETRVVLQAGRLRAAVG